MEPRKEAETPISVTKAHAAVIEATAVSGTPELLGKDLIKKDQDGIRVTLIKLDASIHANAVQCLLHAQTHGDTSLFRRLLVDVIDKGTGYRRQGLIAWMRTFSPMELHGDVIKLTGTINGEPIPWNIEKANQTAFWNLRSADETVALKPVFKGGFVAKIERAIKDYQASIENTLIVDGKVVGPKDAKKPYYNGIHLDKMDMIFDKIASLAQEFQTFSDDTAEVVAARKRIDDDTKFVKAVTETVKEEIKQ